MFHKELARELVEFILPIVEREGGTMSLMDIYCVFNRARGVGTFLYYAPECNGNCTVCTLDVLTQADIICGPTCMN